MRRRNKGRAVNGMLLLNKRTGVSSNHALQEVKRLFSAAKAGHTGSLDPLASGVLPICFGQATKFSQFLLNTTKHYAVDIRLGIVTSTGDAEGKIVSESSVPTLTEPALERILKKFTGTIQQVPPMHSALKKDGVRLYEMARKGIVVERKPRSVTIFDLCVRQYSHPILSLNVHCSKGTYIRTLAEDIGKAIGCGAFVASLQRTKVADFDISDCCDLDQLNRVDSDQRSSYLLPLDRIVQTMPSVEFDNESVFYIRQGQAVLSSQAPATGWVRLYTQGHQFFGIGEVLPDQRVAPRRLIG